MKSFADVIATSWNRKLLFSALFELTYACNLDCTFCYNDLALKGRPLSVEDYSRVFDELRELGTLNLTLSGGEPLSHPDFFAIAKLARDREFLLRIKSNGHAMRGKNLERVARDVRPYRVEVSLHGACAETHDRQTQIKGSFHRLRENLRAMKAAGLRVELRTPITTWNAAEVAAMMTIADDHGFPIRFDTEISPKDDGDESPLDLAISADTAVDVLRAQLDHGRRAAKSDGGEAQPGGDSATDQGQASASNQNADASAPPTPHTPPDHYCGAGSGTIAVDPVGNVYPCVQWRQSMGNLHDHSLVQLWAGSAFESVRDTTRRLQQTRETGTPVSHCPGHAHLLSGDPEKPYATSVIRDEATRRVSLPVVG